MYVDQRQRIIYFGYITQCQSSSGSPCVSGCVCKTKTKKEVGIRDVLRLSSRHQNINQVKNKKKKKSKTDETGYNYLASLIRLEVLQYLCAKSQP